MYYVDYYIPVSTVRSHVSTEYYLEIGCRLLYVSLLFRNLAELIVRGIEALIGSCFSLRVLVCVLLNAASFIMVGIGGNERQWLSILGKCEMYTPLRPLYE
jgi:hypothetical protein